MPLFSLMLKFGIDLLVHTRKNYAGTYHHILAFLFWELKHQLYLACRIPLLFLVCFLPFRICTSVRIILFHFRLATFLAWVIVTQAIWCCTAIGMFEWLKGDGHNVNQNFVVSEFSFFLQWEDLAHWFWRLLWSFYESWKVPREGHHCEKALLWWFSIFSTLLTLLFIVQVPFRLTRMLVKAMEVSGIEGNFRSTCENVMQVLRTNKDSVMAMMEVFTETIICFVFVIVTLSLGLV